MLNLVLSNEEGLINGLVVKDPIGRSDHSMIEFQIQIGSERTESHT